MKGWRRITALMCAVLLTVGSMPVCRGVEEKWVTRRYAEIGLRVTIPAGWTKVTDERYFDMKGEMYDINGWPDSVFAFSAEDMCEYPELKGYGGRAELDELLMTDEAIQATGEAFFEDGYTTSVRKCGAKEYHWLEGVVDAKTGASMAIALRMDNGFLYMFRIFSPQLHEVLSYFEEILSEAEYWDWMKKIEQPEAGAAEAVTDKYDRTEKLVRVEEAGLSLSLAGWDGYVYTRQKQGEGAEMKNAVQTDPAVLQFMELSDTYLVVHPTQEWGEGWEVRVSCTDNEFPDYKELTLERLKLIGEARKQELLADGYEWSEYGVLVHPQTQLIVADAVEERQTVYTYEAGVGKSRVILTITFDGDEVSREEIQRAERTAQSMWFDGLEESSFVYGYEDPEHRLTIPPGWMWVPEEQDPESEQVAFYKPGWPETAFSLMTGEPNDAPEEQTQDNMREWIQEMVGDEFAGEYTISARKYGRWEYHCVEGNAMVEGDQTPMALAIRLDNGIVYVYTLISTQMPEAMADFEQILSDAEYSGQYDPSWFEEDTGIASGVVALGVGAAVAVLCGAAILFRRRRGEKSE